VSSRFPEVTRIYKNHHLDSTRWDVYVPRARDIIVTTSYKSGTTWAQQILGWLLRGDAAALLELREVSPWVDAVFMGPEKEELRELIAALPDRRFLKSHLPLDGLPYYPEVRYIIVGRDPRDVFMSFHNHYRNYTDLIYGVLNDPERLVGEPIAACPEDLRVLWRDWISRGFFEWESEGYPFWANMGHTQSYWSFATCRISCSCITPTCSRTSRVPSVESSNSRTSTPPRSASRERSKRPPLHA
jgi:aryl sulfotransferase